MGNNNYRQETPDEQDVAKELRNLRRGLSRNKQERDTLRQDLHLIRHGEQKDPKPVYEFVKAHQAEFSISAMCRVLRVSRSGYHKWLNRPPSRWEAADRELLEHVRRIHLESRGTYGAPRIQAALWDLGVRASRRRISRLMKTDGLRADASRVAPTCNQ